MLLPVEIGQNPPDFQLPDQDRRIRSLGEFFGRNTLLAFFPGAFTEVCTREMCAFRDLTHAFLDVNAQVVAISVNDPFTNKGFRDLNGLQFPILSDYSRDIIERYDIVQRNFEGLIGYDVAKRSVFILDAKGIVRFKWVSDSPGREPDYAKAKQQLANLYGFSKPPFPPSW